MRFFLSLQKIKLPTIIIMKKIFMLISVSAFLFVSCKGHGPLCPAYSTIKKVEKSETVAVKKTSKGISF